MKKLSIIITAVIVIVIIIVSFILLGGNNDTNIEDLEETESENIDVSNLNKELEELDSLDELLDSNIDSEIIDVS